VFSWRGFLYYKWSMTDFWPQVGNVLRDLRAIRATNVQNDEQRNYIAAAKKQIVESVREAGAISAAPLRPTTRLTTSSSPSATSPHSGATGSRAGASPMPMRKS